MKKFLSAVALSGTAQSQDYARGYDAYEAGDYATALQEWRPLAEQGYEYAQYGIGLLYHSGQGVPQDFEVAHMWSNIASANGLEVAPEFRDRAAQRLTPQDITTAQAMASECMSSNYQNCGY